MASRLRTRILTLFGANTLTFIVVGLSFLAYSRILSPSQFGLYATALSIETILTLVLDGGLKATIIKMEQPFTKSEEATIALVMFTGALLLILLLLAVQKPLLAWRPEITPDFRFIGLFVGLCLFFYPLIMLPTSRMERELEYGHIAWIESIGMMLERGAPALLLLWTRLGLYSFVWALLLSYVFKATILAGFHRMDLFSASLLTLRRSIHLFREGAWIQFGTVSAVVRDNLHVLLLGPLFGKQWIGYYAWALQVCFISSQVFVQISARVSLPLLAQATDFKQRWKICLYQIRFLTMLTVPILCGVWLILPSVDPHFFQGKWQPALALIPLLFVRMIPGLATTPMGPLLMVERKAFVFARANFIWTVAELIVAIALLRLLGPVGLAWSYCVVVWIGLGITLHSLGHPTTVLVRDVAAELFARPSVIFAVLGLLAVAGAIRFAQLPMHASSVAYSVSLLLVICSYLLEPDLRQFLIHEKS
jgi:O-antigen/teichoic acid export membrane protein